MSNGRRLGRSQGDKWEVGYGRRPSYRRKALEAMQPVVALLEEIGRPAAAMTFAILIGTTVTVRQGRRLGRQEPD